PDGRLAGGDLHQILDHRVQLLEHAGRRGLGHGHASFAEIGARAGSPPPLSAREAEGVRGGRCVPASFRNCSIMALRSSSVISMCVSRCESESTSSREGMLSWESTEDMAVSLALRQSAMPRSAGFEIIPCSRWYSCDEVRFSIIFAHASMVPSRRSRTIFVTSNPFSAMTCLSHVHAAVDVDLLPGDVVALGAEERDG